MEDTLLAVSRHYLGTRNLLNMALTNKTYFKHLDPELKRHKFLWKKYYKKFGYRAWARIIQHPFYRTNQHWVSFVPKEQFPAEGTYADIMGSRGTTSWKFVTDIGIFTYDKVPFMYTISLGGRNVVMYYRTQEDYTEARLPDGTEVYYCQLDLRFAVNSLPLLEEPFMRLYITDVMIDGNIPVFSPDQEFFNEFVAGVLVGGTYEVPSNKMHEYKLSTMSKPTQSIMQVADCPLFPDSV